MSEIKRVDKITRDAQEKAPPVYSDIPINLTKHPITGVLSQTINSAAIKRALKNLLSTSKGERRDPTIGCNIKKYMFENFTPQLPELIRIEINDAIEQHEPRVQVVKIVIEEDQDGHSILITVYYTEINNDDIQSVNVTLYRVR